MKTRILNEKIPEDIAAAGEILRAGGVVAIPTETVYGLAANALDEFAVRKIFGAKGRPADNPLIVHVADISEISPLVSEIPKAAVQLAEHFWPGPFTMILPKSPIVPKITTGGLETVAVRVPDNETARAVIRVAGVPLAAPSANTSGKPSPSKFSHVLEDMNGKVDAIVEGEDCRVGVESTVVSLAGKTPCLLRPGAVTVTEIEAVVGAVEIDPAVIGKLEDEAKASSPGMKYKHYAPKANITIIDASPEEYIKYVNGKENAHALCFEEDKKHLNKPSVTFGRRYDGAEQARRYFEALYELDELGAKQVYARIPSKSGIGLAVYNRLVRSAGFQIINPKGYHIIGMTGASGSGKTTIAKAFETLGCAVVDCDKLSKSPGVYDSACLRELAAEFGADIIAEDGTLNRRLLAERAFVSAEKKKKLENIVFPRILIAMQEKINQALEAGKRIIVVDAPTLFEAGFDAICSRIIAVTSTKEEKIKRIMNRDGLSQKEAEKRLSAQHEDSFYTERADHIVSGSGGYDLVKRLTPLVNGLLIKCTEENEEKGET
jgi:dephospho-CoA kinase